MISAPTLAGVTLGLLLAGTAIAAPHRVIIDTDFAMPPQDDGLALALALNSPELDIVAITTVAGNFNLDRANVDVLRMLEMAGRGSIPVFAGAKRPLVHVKDDFAAKNHGTWWSDEAAPPPFGGYARKPLEREAAADALIRLVMASPGEIEIIALGPLTNLAHAIQRQPAFANAVKRLFIMGGAVAVLPDGAGNQTPNAEFNFWVDPEAAKLVLRSGIPIELSPLNVSRKTSLTLQWYDKLVANDTPVTRLIKAQMDPIFAKTPGRTYLMYDEVTVASVIDPTLVKTETLVVDVDATHGINYGVSVGGRSVWPGAEGAQKIAVQHDIDWERFIRLFVERVGAPIK
jgi:inosine-uridine nucleoside N-ribohydrolase